MTIRHLKYLFNPSSIAVVGASTRPGSIGALVCRNLLQGGFSGPIMPVNPKHESVGGVLAYPTIADLPKVPDLAVICTPPKTVPDMITRLSHRGTRAAIIITAGLQLHQDGSGNNLRDLTLQLARAGKMRLLGPNCLGLLVPNIGLNASFSHIQAKPGHIAFVSQSGAMCTAVLDWANSQGIGFSYFISLGDAMDLDFGDVIDYLGADSRTRAILLYIESIHQRGEFMSAARAAARNKPILVIKSGRAPEGIRAAASHTGAMAGSDKVFDSAIRRAGMLRVYELDELFAAVETLARANPIRGNRLGIVTNGGGIGVIAVDSLMERGGVLAPLKPETIQALDAVLPSTWSRSNPVDIIGDASGERYGKAVALLAASNDVDALLVMHAPTATADSTEAALATIAAAKRFNTNILTCWMGGNGVAAAKQAFHQADIPTHDSPERAVMAFMHMVRYAKNQEILMETPPSVLEDFFPATATARLVIENNLVADKEIMSEAESKAVLSAYGIPTVETHIAKSPDDAFNISKEMKFPLALKILSEDIPHKSDIGGVVLFLDSPQGVRSAAESMLKTILEKMPHARIQGFSVQEMAIRPGAHELLVGMTTDPIFGPVIMFGQGGTAVEVIDDSAVALPPLNMNLARELISRTRISRLLKGYRDHKPVHMEALCTILIKLSQLIVDIPEIAELDINPLFADEHGVIAVDARIRISTTHRTGNGGQRLAIRPYPKELEETWLLEGRQPVLLRPIRPEDEPQHHDFISKLSPEDLFFRFLSVRKALPHPEMARLTQIDYNREMAFIASLKNAVTGQRETLGVNRIFLDFDKDSCEFAIVVRSDIKGMGLGRKLMEKTIDYCRIRGIRIMEGHVDPSNHRMIEFVKEFGFSVRRINDHDLIIAHKEIE
ncbi:MAG: bifunctional acetate--CoA ligase family protein/GNAT family N-acetyltransferase [Magnetococcales bacterium]|nr:bifunctional acetate--CoA ligase family protein/GNAT family N-acetyltransferase [Magnetococcales bacterium]MBF0347573.1 bifunctional acetate--CoA ligase family protein/GNAT family N-acetyltransferase [Magnetococcales bacterium]